MLRRCVGSPERVPAQELPVPETKEPERKNRRANKPHYEVSVEEFEPNVAGDTALVNGAAWPCMEVEPRRYRFRVLNPSNGRTYGFHLENADASHSGVPQIRQTAPGHGFLDEVVETGHGDDEEGEDHSEEGLTEVMQFRVTAPTSRHRSLAPEPKDEVASTSNVNARWALQMSRSE